MQACFRLLADTKQLPFCPYYFCASPTAQSFVSLGLLPGLGSVSPWHLTSRTSSWTTFQPGVSSCREIVSLAGFVRPKYSSVGKGVYSTLLDHSI